MIKINEIGFVGIPVTQIARSRAFYEKTLGLSSTLVYESETISWIEFDIGPGTLAITNMSADTWLPTKNGPTPALEVQDFSEAIAHLREAKVTFYSEPIETPGCHLAVISDPDGNSLLIHKRKG